MATGQYNEGHVEEKLEGLESVDRVSKPTPINAESNVSVAFHGEPVAIKLEKQTPELVASIPGERTENGEERNTRAKAHLREGITSVERPEDICGDQIEDRTPAGLLEKFTIVSDQHLPSRRSCRSRRLNPFFIGDGNWLKLVLWCICV